MLNSVSLVGRITKDPALKKTDSLPLQDMTGFDLAIHSYNYSTGIKDTDYIECIAFDKTAHIICNYCGKGSIIAIRGHLKTKFRILNDIKIKDTKVICEQVTFIELKDRAENKKTSKTKIDNRKLQPSKQDIENLQMEINKMINNQ